MFAVWWHYML